MIYKEYKDIHNIKPGTKLWACAYSFDNNKTTMGLIQKPVYGIARGYGWNYSELAEEKSYSAYFIPFKKNSEKDYATSKMVHIGSRVYADTYEECVELYNSLVCEKIDWFRQRIKETEGDLIEQ